MNETCWRTLNDSKPLQSTIVDTDRLEIQISLF
ncbi:hypothetical protein CY0110_19812 [Crocosphaera chwakensis CCY0110]|uniref:Uncharacterized protein n=1 Tax=Crocosphaera chwakensis CCY0110 TaxID=391612 RepID=A3IJU4_9CHRO|nr:hypothetical protein CY0110_19812 [Crocosphaera chwakensis CCY0110]